MKKLILILILIMANSPFLKAQTTAKPDTAKYRFTEPDVVLIDNLLGQLDQCAGNSDRISTSQYNAIHHAVLRLDSVIKVQYFKFHPVKEKAKKP